MVSSVSVDDGVGSFDKTTGGLDIAGSMFRSMMEIKRYKTKRKNAV